MKTFPHARERAGKQRRTFNRLLFVLYYLSQIRNDCAEETLMKGEGGLCRLLIQKSR